MTNSYCKNMVIAWMSLWSLLVMAKPNEIYHRSFWQPQYHGQPLNYCTLKGSQCGMPVATQFCHMMGYERATQATIANNVGLTHFIDTSARCVGWQCNGFKTIECTSTISDNPPQAWHYRFKRFVYPGYNHYRVDWCYDGHKGCGQKAAFSFCRRMGYMGVKKYTVQKHIAATQAIGNQKLCFGTDCNAFAEINCYR